MLITCPYCEHDQPTVAYDEQWGYICDPCKLRNDARLIHGSRPVEETRMSNAMQRSDRDGVDV
jgi:hypothetical protein